MNGILISKVDEVYKVSYPTKAVEMSETRNQLRSTNLADPYV